MNISEDPNKLNQLYRTVRLKMDIQRVAQLGDLVVEGTDLKKVAIVIHATELLLHIDGWLKPFHSVLAGVKIWIMNNKVSVFQISLTYGSSTIPIWI